MKFLALARIPRLRRQLARRFRHPRHDGLLVEEEKRRDGAVCVEDVGPVEAVWAFVNAYDEWAQRGYTPSVPEELADAVTEKGLPGLDSDARWYSRGKVRQVGSMVVSEVELLSNSGTDAVVGALLDTTGIRVLANGKETFRSTEEADLIHRVRIGLVFDGRWRIDVIDTVE